MPKKDAVKNRIIETAEDYQLTKQLGDFTEEKAYLARELIQATLPHRQPKGSPPEWVRKNGHLTLSIRPGYKTDEKTGERVCIGYPSGTIPRLLLYWLNTEAKKTKSRKIKLGDSLNGFLVDLGLNPATGGGKRGDAHRCREQMERLFRASLSFQYSTPQFDSWLDMQVAPKGQMWWDFKNPDQRDLFNSWIELSEDFYNAITANAVPLNMEVLRAIKNSALALDLYAWAVHRSYAAHKRGKRYFVSWQILSNQFGSQYANPKDFKRACKEALNKIEVLHPELNLSQVRGGIEVATPARLITSEGG